MAQGFEQGGDILTSMSNPSVKRVRSLQQRKFRLRERAFVVEGVRAVEDVLAAGIQPLAFYLRSDVEFPLAREMDIPRRRVSVDVFDQLTDVAHPQGVLAVVPMLEDAPLPSVERAPCVVVLDGIKDPGNMGTLFRSAAGAGVDHLFIGSESVDPYHPKVVRAAMGAHVRIGFSQGQIAESSPYFRDFPVIALADAGGNALYDSVNWQLACVIIIGSEAFGPSMDSHEIANTMVSIPLHNGVESLNAGVAGSLLMFEMARQRRSIRAT